MRVLVCAGGTGGGIYPALTAVSELEARGVSREQILWVGTQGEMEENLVPRTGLKLQTIQGGAVVGVPLTTRVKNLAKLTWSVGTAHNLIRQFKPDVMLMTGGYMAAPVALAARLHGVPIVIFLPDVEPGSAIKSVMPLADKVACTTDLSREFVPADKLVVTGYPLRPEIRAATQMGRADALAQFDLADGRATLLVFGGSRGSWNINKALMDSLPDLLPHIQIIHISGTLTWPQVEEYAKTLPADLRRWYRPYPYLHEEMGAAFRAADLALARAGASMLGESPAFGLPTILVPLAFAWRYQKVNADYLTERGAAVQSTDERLPDELTELVLGLLQDPARLEQMRQAAQALAVPQAAANLAQVIQRAANLDKESPRD
ncbi:MAG: UDP-N-acetylglucosamine--N-acetylmuramyl-(pentapeptide) pyrophosphoryl-undecaprenol N-acetylglucosamine transferase [Ardenticatenaceae bacterium]|nr:UDP-N-acetylglucosamine--N-acetylmuramyl-(pentapeptide) pyrophosphoryl-undecaprenol N-acetylglucosamine transferase [Ardenticatenaceae bacterium]